MGPGSEARPAGRALPALLEGVVVAEGAPVRLGYRRDEVVAAAVLAALEEDEPILVINLNVIQ